MTEYSILICPVCAESLQSQEKSYLCSNNHSFDKAKQGYVNLLLSNQKKTLAPGDNKEMVKSRLDFLKRGFYHPIVEALNTTIEKTIQTQSLDKPNIADLGCGVGYYLSALKNHLKPTFPQSNYWGVDISKEAIHCANQHDKDISWLVASTKQLPIASESVDILLSVFSPIYHDEVQRVLSPNGRIFVVTPAQNHLFELRRVLFDEIKDIDADKILEKTKDDFVLEESIAIKATAHLQSKDEIENLLKMTPFYWRSSAIKKDYLLSLDALTVTIDVTLWVFKV